MAENESRYRALNERQVDAAESFRGQGEDRMLEIVCECTVEGCEEMIELASSDYAEVRAHADRFIVAPDHVVPAVEDVLSRSEHYWVVEKIGAGADVARELE